MVLTRTQRLQLEIKKSKMPETTTETRTNESIIEDTQSANNTEELQEVVAQQQIVNTQFYARLQEGGDDEETVFQNWLMTTPASVREKLKGSMRSQQDDNSNTNTGATSNTNLGDGHRQENPNEVIEDPPNLGQAIHSANKSPINSQDLAATIAAALHSLQDKSTKSSKTAPTERISLTENNISIIPEFWGTPCKGNGDVAPSVHKIFGKLEKTFPEEIRLEVLELRSRGAARLFLNRLPAEISYKDAKERIFKRFASILSHDDYAKRVQNMRRDDGETLTNFAERLLTVVQEWKDSYPQESTTGSIDIIARTALSTYIPKYISVELECKNKPIDEGTVEQVWENVFERLVKHNVDAVNNGQPNRVGGVQHQRFRDKSNSFSFQHMKNELNQNFGNTYPKSNSFQKQNLNKNKPNFMGDERSYYNNFNAPHQPRSYYQNSQRSNFNSQHPPHNSNYFSKPNSFGYSNNYRPRHKFNQNQQPQHWGNNNKQNHGSNRYQQPYTQHQMQPRNNHRQQQPGQFQPQHPNTRNERQGNNYQRASTHNSRMPAPQQNTGARPRSSIRASTISQAQVFEQNHSESNTPFDSQNFHLSSDEWDF